MKKKDQQIKKKLRIKTAWNFHLIWHWLQYKRLGQLLIPHHWEIMKDKELFMILNQFTFQS